MLRRTRNAILVLRGSIPIVVLAFSFGLFTWALRSGEAQGSPTIDSQLNTPTLDDTEAVLEPQTENWPTLINHDFGFQIKYPPNYYVVEWEPDARLALYISFLDKKWLDSEEGPEIGLSVYVNRQEQTLMEWFNSHAGSYPLEGNMPQSLYFVDSVVVKPVTTQHQNILVVRTGGVAPSHRTLIQRDTSVFELFYGPPDTESAYILQAIYELMLSTLEFID